MHRAKERIRNAIRSAFAGWDGCIALWRGPRASIQWNALLIVESFMDRKIARLRNEFILKIETCRVECILVIQSFPRDRAFLDTAGSSAYTGGDGCIPGSEVDLFSGILDGAASPSDCIGIMKCFPKQKMALHFRAHRITPQSRRII